MGVQINLPVLFQQMPHVEHVASVQQSGPELAQTMMQADVVKAQEKLREQVQQPEAQDPSVKVKPDGQGQGGADGRSRRQRKRRQQAAGEEQEHKLAPARTPFAGNIVNRSV